MGFKIIDICITSKFVMNSDLIDSAISFVIDGKRLFILSISSVPSLAWAIISIELKSGVVNFSIVSIVEKNLKKIIYKTYGISFTEHLIMIGQSFAIAIQYTTVWPNILRYK